MSKQTDILRRSLRQHRLDSRLSYAQLARAIGLSEAGVRNFINGTHKTVHETTAYAVRSYLTQQGLAA